MIESKLQILNQKDYWVGRNKHYGILCTAHFDSIEITHDIDMQNELKGTTASAST